MLCSFALRSVGSYNHECALLFVTDALRLLNLRVVRESVMKEHEWRHFDTVSSSVSGITGMDRCVLAKCLSTPQKRRV